MSSIVQLSKENPARLAEKIVRLRYTNEEQERAINVIRQALEHQRKIAATMNSKFQKELEQRLSQQKQEYEATIKRHQTFIDQVNPFFDQ